MKTQIRKIVKAAATIITRHRGKETEHVETEEQRAERERLTRDYDRTHPPGVDRASGCC